MNVIKIKDRSILELKEILKNPKENELDQSTISMIKKQIISMREKNIELLDNLINSPYYNIASQYWDRKGVYEPTGLHAIWVFGEFAKIDHRINKNIKDKDKDK